MSFTPIVFFTFKPLSGLRAHNTSGNCRKDANFQKTQSLVVCSPLRLARVSGQKARGPAAMILLSSRCHKRVSVASPSYLIGQLLEVAPTGKHGQECEWRAARAVPCSSSSPHHFRPDTPITLHEHIRFQISLQQVQLHSPSQYATHVGLQIQTLHFTCSLPF